MSRELFGIELTDEEFTRFTTTAPLYVVFEEAPTHPGWGDIVFGTKRGDRDAEVNVGWYEGGDAERVAASFGLELVTRKGVAPAMSANRKGEE